MAIERPRCHPVDAFSGLNLNGFSFFLLVPALSSLGDISEESGRCVSELPRGAATKSSPAGIDLGRCRNRSPRHRRDQIGHPLPDEGLSRTYCMDRGSPYGYRIDCPPGSFVSTSNVTFDRTSHDMRGPTRHFVRRALHDP